METTGKVLQRKTHDGMQHQTAVKQAEKKGDEKPSHQPSSESCSEHWFIKWQYLGQQFSAWCKFFSPIVPIVPEGPADWMCLDGEGPRPQALTRTLNPTP